jgi:cell division septation protein DedD
MRFEIRAGGAILILLGLAVLSGVVFALGLAAGYQMARQNNTEPAQVAGVYSVPNAPSGPDTSSAKSSAKSSSDDTDSDNAPPETTAKSSSHKTKEKSSNVSDVNTLSMDKDAGPVTPPSRVANQPAPTSPKPGADTAAGEGAAPPRSGEKYASVSSGSSSRHKPFNIQIDAVMDHTNADQMASRLQRLGYHAFLVPTDIGGQTWWRVRVGPYQSEDEASSAEQELRSRYKDTYTEQ